METFASQLENTGTSQVIGNPVDQTTPAAPILQGDGLTIYCAPATYQRGHTVGTLQARWAAIPSLGCPGKGNNVVQE